MNASRMPKTKNPRLRARIIGTAFLGILACALYAWAVMSNPFPFYAHDTGSVIRIDGVSFLRGKGRMYLYPWKWAYDIEVETPTEVVRTRLYPWAEKSRSGSIHVDEKGVVVIAETRDISPRLK